ncbi:hypothetical protein [Streptomyces sp. LN549]|uniref:hypothetical protein n=1 Tax=Streptomyces sp. LN549 TaxID=3112979 RepID=UPI0037163773
MVFPSTPLDVRTEIQVGGTWVDVTADTYTRDPITISRGTADEASSTEPSTCSLTLNNRSGRYSPRNPMSPYFGLIGRNTPVRVSVPGSESYLALDGTTSGVATTPDVAALDIVGDIDIRVEATADWYAAGSQALTGKWITATSQKSYLLRIADSTVILNWSADGATTLFASQPLPALPRRAALRATLDVNNGAGGFTATLYWAESLAGPWTVIGAPFSAAGVTSVYAGTAALELAPLAATSVTPLRGRIHRAEVRNGIGGTVVASPDFRAKAPGMAGFTDSAGRVWSVTGTAGVSNRQYRFVGEISAWPPRWDVSGKDVWTPIEAAGILRRMGQGKKALGSTLRRRIPSFAPLAYWPCEEDDGATLAYSPIAGVTPLRVSQPGWRFGQDDTLAGSAALPTVDGGATMDGSVPAPAVTPTEWSVHMVYSVDAAPASMSEFLSWRATGTVQRWQIQQMAGSAHIYGYNSADDLVVDQGVTIGPDVFEGWQRFHFYVTQSGGTVTWRLDWNNIGGPAGGIGSTYSGTVGRVTQISTRFGSTVTGLRVGHIAVIPVATTAAYVQADHGFSGETALNRMSRLASEEAAQLDLSWLDGDTGLGSERMGPQRPNTLIDLLGEAEETDGGILYERLDRAALVYRDRASLYNQRVALALNYNAKGEVPPPLEPTEDDQKIRNDVTVSRSGGSSGRVVQDTGPLSVNPPPAGVGPYDEAVTLSLYDDTQPQQIAGWRVHLGTVDEARYPTIAVWLHAAPHLVDTVLALDIGDRLQISNPPAWLPPATIDQHIRGYTEVLDQFEWSLIFNCAPAAPWRVGVVGDAVLGRADTDGSSLASAATSTATTLSVATTSGPVWVTTAAAPADFPFAVTIGGEQMTVTAISGASSPQTFTVTRSVNGIVKSQTSGTDVRLTVPSIVAL